MGPFDFDILGLVFYMFALLPPRGEKDIAFRYESAIAIVAATNSPEERLTLAKIQREESGFRRNVARCEISGDRGKSKGAWQIQPISGDDAKAVCGSLYEQATVALRYLRHSADVCSKNTGVAKYNLYMSGRCDHGTKAAEKRIVLDAEAEGQRFFPHVANFEEVP
jgi:hypothetical protein